MASQDYGKIGGRPTSHLEVWQASPVQSFLDQKIGTNESIEVS